MTTVEEFVRVDVGSHALAATVVAPRRRVPGVLFVHGWGGSQLQYLTRARQVAALGCVCLTFDLSGHEATRSQWTTVSRETNLRDVIAAFDLLASRPEVDDDAMAVVGSSYGGYLGAILTVDRPVRWLAMRAPALYYDDGWALPKLQLHRDFDLVSYRRRRIATIENRALRACAAFRGDVLLVESERDEIVPHPVAQSYREACARSRSLVHEVIHEADHGLTSRAHQDAYTSLLVRWFAEQLAVGRAGVEATPSADRAPPEVPPKTG
jgi:dienelactone hydrolase